MKFGFIMTGSSRLMFFAFLLLMLLPLSAMGQEPLSYAETIQTPTGCSDSIYHQIVLWSAERIKEDNRNEMVVHNCFKDKGILLLKLYQDFRTGGTAKEIADKISNVPIVGKKVKGITDLTNLGIDGYLSCFLTIEVEDGSITIKQERFSHTAYAELASQGLIYMDESVADSGTDLIINKGQYKAMQQTALPQCLKWWEQTVGTLKDRVKKGS